MQNDNLDDFIMQNGNEISSDMKILDNKEVDMKFDDKFTLSYGNDTPIPGENTINKINGLEDINEKTALDSLIIKSALIKAKKENEEKQTKKLTKKDREPLKKQFIDSMMYQQEEDYYQKHHYMMDGKTKRGTRKRLERLFDKGRYDKYLLQNRKSLND